MGKIASHQRLHFSLATSTLDRFECNKTRNKQKQWSWHDHFVKFCSRHETIHSGIHGKHMVTTESLPVQLVGFWCNVSAKCCFTNYFTCHNFYIPDFFLVIIVNNNKTSLILVKNIVLYISSFLHDYRLSMTLNSTDNRSISCLAVFLYHLINDWSVGKHQTA